MPYDLNQLAQYYAGLSDGELVYVNSFGEPFFNVNGALIKVSPETGDHEDVGLLIELNNLDDYWSMNSIKEVWEESNNELIGEHHFLFPITPFVLGGEYSIDNLKKIPIHEAVDVYKSIRDVVSMLPDGAKIKIEVVRK